MRRLEIRASALELYQRLRALLTRGAPCNERGSRNHEDQRYSCHDELLQQGPGNG